jgi:hypothetical protein
VKLSTTSIPKSGQRVRMTIRQLGKGSRAGSTYNVGKWTLHRPFLSKHAHMLSATRHLFDFQIWIPQFRLAVPGHLFANQSFPTHLALGVFCGVRKELATKFLLQSGELGKTKSTRRAPESARIQYYFLALD